MARNVFIPKRYAHKTVSWYLSGILFKISEEHPGRCYMSLPQDPGQLCHVFNYHNHTKIKLFSQYQLFSGNFRLKDETVCHTFSADIFPRGKIWTASLSSECVTAQVGDVITMLCHVPGETLNIYRWTKDNRTIIDGSKDGVLNLTVSSVDDFGLYSCHVINSEGNTIYNITICQRTSLEGKVTQGMT